MRALATAESVLTLSLQVEQFRRAALAWRILVSHSRLHDLLQPLALVLKVVESLIFIL